MVKNKFSKIYGDNSPLFINMLIACLVFASLVLVALWVIGYGYSDTVYRNIRKKNAQENAELIAQNIDHPDLQVLVKRVAYESDVCIMVVDKDGNVYYSQDTRTSCNVHAFTSLSAASYYDKAKDNKGTYGEIIPANQFIDNYNEAGFVGDIPRDSGDGQDAYLYACNIKNAEGVNLVILVDALIVPQKGMSDTIVIQLIILSIITAVFSGLLSYFLTKRVTNPIIELTAQAREISSGDADMQITGRGYKEITELKESLQEAADEVAEVEHYRRELIANVSHDLRTPLTLIKGYAELMRDIPSEATPENLQVVIDESTRLTTLVNDMLALSKEQEGNEGLNLERFDIVEYLDALILRHGKLIEHLGYAIEWEHDKEAYVIGDKSKVAQVVYNLINNAVNYAGEDKKVIVKEYVKGDVVRIEVTDHGEGVDVEVLPHIWDRYYKSDKSHKRAAVGTGLGLSIVKSVMSKHPGGAYGVITSIGEGSTFYIELQRV
ncbi:MAG: HAMP domain-containing histidine kinase [Clostridia bacterium]|nr:HAMP domain-containing histidine kinase [Clostridia bacterium]